MATAADRPIGERMTAVETWKDKVDVDLYGRNGDPGLVRDYHDSRAEHEGRMKLITGVVSVGGLLGIVAMILDIAERVHRLTGH